MPIDPGTAGTVITVAKKLYDLVRKSDNPELLNQILELQRAAFDSEDERRAMRDKIAELEEELRYKGQLVFRNDESSYYDKDTKDGPFCSACWDGRRKAIRMHTEGGRYNCPVCNVVVKTEAERRLDAEAIADHNARVDREYGNW